MPKWTRFHDMHSGGGLKEEPYARIYIEAPEDEARVIFYNRFGHSPDRVSCTGCGEDYSLTEADSLEQATAFARGCRYAYFDGDGKEVPEAKAWRIGKGMMLGRYVEDEDKGGFKVRPFETLDDYIKRKDVLVIRADEITAAERQGTVPKQGFVWQD